MVARKTLRRRFTSCRIPTFCRISCGIERLEGRTLLSAWSTVDNVPGAYNGVTGMTADTAGNVYAVGNILLPDGSGATAIREKAANSLTWTTLCTIGGAVARANAIAVDAKGDLFVTATTVWNIWEVPHGSSTPVVIDSATGGAFAVAVDPSGSVYAAGQFSAKSKGGLAQNEWSVRKGTFNSASGSWTFNTIDQISAASAAQAVGFATTTVNGVTSTAAYVAGSVGSSWVVRKSINGGSWSQVDSFRYDSTGSAGSGAYAVGADLSGNVYVGGFGQAATITGYTKSHTPIYSYANHWIVRKTSNGGSSWNTDDNFYPGSSDNSDAYAICVNPQTGAMDVAGYRNDGSSHGIVRTNAGGVWSTIDDYMVPQGASYYAAVAADTSGNAYAGGQNGNGMWTIRSQPAAPTNLSASPDTVAPSSQIDLSWTNAASGDETGFGIYRSFDGGATFTQVATVSAGVTTYSDSGLTAGTTYSYYVVTLLNSDGSSAPSTTASATTSL